MSKVYLRLYAFKDNKRLSKGTANFTLYNIDIQESIDVIYKVFKKHIKLCK